MRPAWSSRVAAAYAFTIETDEQMRMKVLRAVIGIARTVRGSGHGAPVPQRRMMYDPISAVKNITSETRKTHIPTFWV